MSERPGTSRPEQEAATPLAASPARLAARVRHESVQIARRVVRLLLHDLNNELLVLRLRLALRSEAREGPRAAALGACERALEAASRVLGRLAELGRSSGG